MPGRGPYFGYYVIAALFTAEIAVTGISFYSFSLFIRAWQADPELGWSLTQINSSFLVGLPLAFLSPFMGRLVDTRGPKLVMLMGIPLIALSFGLRAFMTEIWHLWALQGLLVAGQSAAFLGTGKLVGLWFTERRGRMMGIALAGNNAGGMIMAPLSAFLLTLIDWRTLFIIYGVSLLVANTLIVALLIRDKPADVAREARRVGRRVEAETADQLVSFRTAHAAGSGTRPAGDQGETLPAMTWRASLRTTAFWLIALAFFASFASIFAVLNQLGKHLEIVGIDIKTAGTALGFLGGFGLIGKILFGFVAEKIPVRFGFAIVSVLQIVGIGFLLFLGSPSDAWLLWPFVMIYGVGFGAVGALMPLVVLDTFGIVSYGTIYGVMQLLLRFGNGGLPPLVGFSVDATGTYTVAFIVTVAALAAGTVAVFFARPRVSPTRRPTP